MGFVDALRMNNIYAPSGGAGLLQPNMNGGGGGMDPNSIMQSIMQLREQAKNQDENRQYRMMNFQDNMQRRNNAPKPPSALEQIGNAMTQSNGQPMNTVVSYPDDDRRNSMRMTDYQRAMVEQNKGKLTLAEQQALQKDQNADAERAIRQQRADTYSSIHDLSDAEKLDIMNRARAGDIQARGMLQQILEEQRQGGRETIQGMRGDTQTDIANSRNATTLQGIADRVAGQKDVANIRANKVDPNSPNEDRTAQWNAAQQIINTNPELAPFITLGQNGQFTIEPPGEKNFFGFGGGPTPEQYQKIQEAIYKTGMPRTTTTLPVTPSTPPATAQPLTGSRFKATVR